MVKIRNGLIVNEDESIEREGLLSQGTSSSDNPSHVAHEEVEESNPNRFVGTGRAVGNTTPEMQDSTLLPLETNTSPNQTSTSWTQTIQTQFQSFVTTLQTNAIVRNIQQFLFMDLSFFGIFNFKVIYFVVLSLLMGFIFGWQSLLISFIFIIVLYFCAAARNFNMTQEQRTPQPQQQQPEQQARTTGRTLGRTGNIHTLH